MAILLSSPSYIYNHHSLHSSCIWISKICKRSRRCWFWKYRQFWAFCVTFSLSWRIQRLHWFYEQKKKSKYPPICWIFACDQSLMNHGSPPQNWLTMARLSILPNTLVIFLEKPCKHNTYIYLSNSTFHNLSV